MMRKMMIPRGWMMPISLYFIRLQNILSTLTSTIEKISRPLLSVLLVGSLSACGLISQGEETLDPDVEGPVVIKFEPTSLKNRKLDPNTKEIKFYFSEELDKTTVDSADATPVAFTSLGGGTVDFSVAYNDVTATEEGKDDEHIVTITLNTPLEEEQTYSIVLSDTIKDNSENKNKLEGITPYQFTTPRSFAVYGVLNGLKGDIKLSLEIPSQETTEDLLIARVDEVTEFRFESQLFDQDTYKLKISHLDTTIGYCATTKSSGFINNADERISITCDRVTPVFPDQSEWNNYDFEIEGDLYKTHLGMLRFLELPDTVTSCDNLEATDVLGVFKWSCKQSGDKYIVYNTGINDGKGLSNLIDFDATSWQSNRIIVKIGGSEITVDSTLAIWWNNPVFRLSSGLNQLTTQGGIYIVNSSVANSGIDVSVEGIAEGKAWTNHSYAILVEPGATLKGYSSALTSANATTLKINRSAYIWIEGAFNSGADRLLDVFNSAYVVVRNASFNGGNTGIVFNNSFRENFLSNVVVSGSAENGVELLGQGKEYGNVLLDNVTSVSNGGHGMLIEGDRIKVTNSIVADNGQDGVRVTGLDNRLANISSYSNKGNGLSLSGARSTSVAMITATANTGYGIDITGTSRYNYIGHSTLANNFAGGIKNDATEATTNTYYNVADAYNTGAVCDGCTDVTDTLATAFVGSVATDATSSYDSSAAPSYGYLTPDFSLGLDNTFRSWTKTPDLITTDNSTGNCSTPDGQSCYVVDWSLKTGSALLSQNSDFELTNDFKLLFSLDSADSTAPANSVDLDGDLDGICEYTEACLQTISHLKNAYEVMGDKIGNDNNLCESGETCIITPNIGSYQGHGDLSAATAPTGYTFQQYGSNGN